MQGQRWLLLAHKADRNVKDSEEKTALDLANENGNEKIIRLLEKQR